MMKIASAALAANLAANKQSVNTAKKPAMVQATDDPLKGVRGDITDFGPLGRLVYPWERGAIRSVYRPRKNTTYFYASKKAGVVQPCDSAGESLLAHREEVATITIDYQLQPFRAELLVNGVWRTYIPDCASDLSDGSVRITEIKYDDEWLDDADYFAKLEAFERLINYLGWDFEVVTLQQLEANAVVLANIHEIQLDRLKAYDEFDTFAVIECLRRHGGTAPLGAIEAAVDGGPRARGKARAMMVDRLISIDLHRPLGPTSVVSIVDRTPRPSGLTFNQW